MPILKPKPGEPKDEFVKRFIEDSKMKEDFPDNKERKAMALEQYAMDSEKEEPEKKKKLFTLDEVEIFEAGKWNGDTYTEKDLDDMVSAFSETRGLLKPFLKLGHSHNQSLLQKDGMPAAGWITELKRKGKKLLAKIENIPEKIYSLIENRAYGRVSSEIFWNLKLNGKRHRRALKAVALLGADTPEVGTLSDFINLYTENYEGELKHYHILEKEKNMDAEKNIFDLEARVKEFEIQLENKNKELDRLSKENSELKNYAAEVEYKKAEQEVINYLEGQVEKGLITPAQVDYFTALAMDGEVKTYTNKDSQKIEGKSFDLVKSIIENANPIVDLGEKSKHIEPEKKMYSKENKEDELHNKILEYSKNNNVSYAEAFDIISYEEVE